MLSLDNIGASFSLLAAPATLEHHLFVGVFKDHCQQKPSLLEYECCDVAYLNIFSLWELHKVKTDRWFCQVTPSVLEHELELAIPEHTIDANQAVVIRLVRLWWPHHKIFAVTLHNRSDPCLGLPPLNLRSKNLLREPFQLTENL
jgi:hypothetical protein